jgi:hypothetical protein
MVRERIKNKSFYHIVMIVLASLVLGGIIQWILPVGDFIQGSGATALIIFLCGLVLYLAWRIAGQKKILAWMMLLAFILRLAFAVFFAWGLPRFGYNEDPQEAGFLFRDAFQRETGAWGLAQSEESLTAAFRGSYGADQYGGLMATSAAVYRTISPDAFRPVLISILAASAMALSLPFLLGFAAHWSNSKIAVWAGWIFVLYPEGILLGGSQMREPFMILFVSMLLWSASQLLNRTKLKSAIPTLLLSILGLFLFSYRVAVLVVGAVLVWLWVAVSARFAKAWQKWLGWLLIIVVGGTLMFVFRSWINEVFRWDALVTFRQSGMVQFQLENLPKFVHFPFILVYGLFQPVLPAAIVDPAPWIWRGLAIFRAAGWYTLLPLLIFAIFRVWKAKPKDKQRWLIIFMIIVWAWILISAARAGGDQWDNPRYRTIFLPWMAMLGAWVINDVVKSKNAWFGRMLIIEGIFLFFFGLWYVDRYYLPNLRVAISVILVLIIAFSLLVIIWGIVRDRKRRLSLTETDEKL